MKRKHLFALILLLLMVSILAGCQSTADRWQEQYDLGMKYLSEGNYDEAVIAFNAAIEIDPKQAPAYVGRGDAYVFLGQKNPDYKTPEGLTWEEAAQKDYEQAITLDETDEKPYLGLADIYIRQGDYDKALEILQKGQEKAGGDELEKKIKEFEDGIITDSSGDVRTVINDKPNEGGSKYLEAIEVKPGGDLTKAVEGKSDVVIVLGAGDYVVDGVFDGLNNITILGREGTNLISYSGEDMVAMFENCKGLTLKNLTIGHELPQEVSSCTAGVLWFTNTEVTLENCDIFGCGVYGISAWYSNITAKDTIIRDCSSSIMELGSTEALFQNCTFSGNGYSLPDPQAMWIYDVLYWNGDPPVEADSYTVAFSGCTFTENKNPELYHNDAPEKISVVTDGCTFSGNAWV